jgi:hypothetical protein
VGEEALAHWALLRQKKKKVFYVLALCKTADVKASIHFRFLIWQQ